jgi:beta-lactam-binding protein with PASTA domain/tRNA A-37 threonylcarbamoyl transferase component Bud32
VSSNSTDPLIGRLIDGRYQVRSRIARGGMATVYLATDLRLDRRVAIKVMHGHLADDSQYKARFIQEARSAARLAHPNVVNVYDQGQDAETAYLVMEYLPGITLRDLLQEHHILTPVQAMDIMEAVLSGLAAAHRNGIVHRDLKPENVLLADDGRIKIGDFGLARAATASTATGNALLGTIAYLSPELVTRGVADTRSDIYSVGIMLYEMLAGEQPFKGEQVFQIAQQHATETVPTPSSKNRSVPAELDELVLWATARDPDQRPHDAGAMLSQLLETQKLLLESSSGTAATTVQHTRVMTAPQVPVASNAQTQILRPITPVAVADKSETLAHQSARRRTKGFWLFSLVVLLAALAGGTGWYFGSGPGALVSVPSVAGQSVEAATATLKAADLTVAAEVKTAYSIDVAPGMVIGTTPEKGASVAHGEKITLTTSLGPKPVALPALVGQTEEAALAAIADAGFAAQPSQIFFDDKVPEHIVMAARGAGDVDLAPLKEYGEGQPITLTVSLGAIPDVSGLSVADAQRNLENVQLTGSTDAGLHDWSDTVTKGKVIRAQLKKDAGPATHGTVVDLVISDGVEQVQVPDVTGKRWNDAKKTLTDLGFKVALNGKDRALAESFLADLATVKSTDPKPGKAIDKGSTVMVDLEAFAD